MKKITPEMLTGTSKVIEVPAYDWKKQSRIDAAFTTHYTNSTTWTNNRFGGTQLDTTNDSISD